MKNTIILLLHNLHIHHFKVFFLQHWKFHIDEVLHQNHKIFQFWSILLYIMIFSSDHLLPHHIKEFIIIVILMISKKNLVIKTTSRNEFLDRFCVINVHIINYECYLLVRPFCHWFLIIFDLNFLKFLDIKRLWFIIFRGFLVIMELIYLH